MSAIETEAITLESMRDELVAALNDKLRAMEAVASARDALNVAHKALEQADARVSSAERNLIGMCVPDGYAERHGEIFGRGGAW